MNLNRVCNYEDWELLGLDEQPKRRKTWEVEMARAKRGKAA